MPGSVASRTAPLLVKPAWVFERLAMMRVFDASWYLPSAQRQPLVEFEQAHIPSARFFDIDEVSDKSIPLPHMLPTPQQFADFIGTKSGVSNADHVIVYDTKGIWSACRVYWTFRVRASPFAPSL